jgi:two-component system, OmpR family, alkaline phosphatase synthesis response regulator PhoP
MKRKIAIVEDDKKIADLVKLYLEKEDFEVFIANDGEKGLEIIRKLVPDLIILDLMLPKIDGLTVARKVFQEDKIPIIMLTAKGEEVDKIIGLEIGADDYITKPFSPRELVSRVKAVLRRSESAGKLEKDDIVVIDDLEINPQKFLVKKNGEKISLTRKEFAILLILSKHPGRVFSRQDLMNQIYTIDDEPVFDRTVDVHISNLRNKLKDRSQKLIATVSGIGYKLKINDED